MLVMLMIRPSTKSFTVHSNMEDIAREAGSINLEEDTLFSMYYSKLFLQLFTVLYTDIYFTNVT